MSNVLYVEDGSEIYLDFRYTCKSSETSYIIYSEHENDPLIFQKNFENAITKSCAENLIKKKIANKNKSDIFNDPELCKAIFNWDSNEEIENILNIFHIGSYKSILDVGCGYGRIFLPLYKKGLDIVGIDISHTLITDIKSRIDKDDNKRLLCADISSVIIPEAFDFGYASMNTLRYIESYFLLKKHLINIAFSFKQGGCYMFQVTIYPDITMNYHNKWQFEYRNKLYDIEWKNFNNCRVYNKLIDQVIIGHEGETYAIEYQKQLFLSYDIISNILQEIKHLWEFEKTFDSKFIICDLTHNSRGNFWFILRRK